MVSRRRESVAVVVGVELGGVEVGRLLRDRDFGCGSSGVVDVVGVDVVDGDGVLLAERDRVMRAGMGDGVGFFLRFEIVRDSDTVSDCVGESLSVDVVLLTSRLRLRGLGAVGVVVDVGACLEVWKYWFSRPLNVVLLFTGTSSSSL